jgi:hypothetical protein
VDLASRRLSIVIVNNCVICRAKIQHNDTKLIASRVEEAFKINKRMDDRGTGLLRLSSTRSAASKSKTLHRKDYVLTGHSKFDKSVVSD